MNYRFSGLENRNDDFRCQPENVFDQKCTQPCRPLSTTEICTAKFMLCQKYQKLITKLLSIISYFWTEFCRTEIMIGHFWAIYSINFIRWFKWPFLTKMGGFGAWYRALSIRLSILFSIFLNLGHNDVIKPFSLIFLFLLVVFKLDRFL